MENILVTVRFKPYTSVKKEDNDKNTAKPKLGECWKVILDPHNVVCNLRSKQSFTYDYVFGEDSTNTQVFEILGLPLIQSALEGISTTIFAYGQTSSGKTYTIQGNLQNPGLITLGIDYIFHHIRNSQRKYTLKISYLEVYNEQVNDLLDTSKTNLEIRERPDKGIYVEKLSEFAVENESRAYELLSTGESNRKIGETSMNQQSSRSHTIFRVSIESSDVISTFASQLNFVDLAGSEGVQKTKAEDLRLREGSNINKSLLSLSSVIQKLSEAKGGKNFINFRDSKMTRLLQPSLSGNSKTAVICTINPDISHYQETMNTLLFGSKAKKIKTDAKLNEIMINEEQIRLTTEDNKRLTEKNQEIEVALNQYKDCVLDLQYKIDGILQQNERNTARLNNQIQEIQSFNLDLHGKIVESQVLQNNLEKEIDRINQDNSILIAHKKELEGALNEKNNKIDEISQIIQEKNNILKNYQGLFEDLNAKIKDIQNTNEILNEKIRDLNEKNKSYSVEIESLKGRLKDQAEAYCVLKDASKVQESEFESLKILNESLVKEKSELQEELDDQISQKLYLDQEVIDLKYEIRQFLSHTSYYNEEKPHRNLQQILDERVKLTQQLDQLIQDHEILSDSHQAAVSQIKALKEQNEAYEKELLTYKENTQKCQEEIKTLQRQNQHKRLSASFVNENMLESLSKSEKYHMSVSLAESIEENKILKEDLGLANKFNTELKQDIENTKKLCSCLTSEKKILEDRVDELEKSLAKAKNDFAYLMAEREDQLYDLKLSKTDCKACPSKKFLQKT
jgi:centromeric protein E